MAKLTKDLDILNKKILQRRGGKKLPSSWPLIRIARENRASLPQLRWIKDFTR